MKKNVFLVSDSSGETVSNIARSCFLRFEDLEIKEHIWPLVKTRGQIDKLIRSVKRNNGMILYTIVNSELRSYLKEKADALEIPLIGVLENVIKQISSELKIKPMKGDIKSKNELDEDYYDRMEAINFTLNHDDGQLGGNIGKSDIILVGVSRTSKSPTCVFLAYKGYKSSNIPFVPSCPLPKELFEISNKANSPLIVGLTINSERLIQIRKNRLLSIQDREENSYVDIEKIEQELLEAKKLFLKNNWPIIDVTRRSVEETAAQIIKLYIKKQLKEKKE